MRQGQPNFPPSLSPLMGRVRPPGDRSLPATLSMLAALLIVSCAHAPTVAEGPPVSDYYPLAVGNSWTYDVTMLGAKQQQKISIDKEEKGQFYDSAGNELSQDAFGVRDQKRYLLRAPLEVGTKWNNVVSVSSYEQYQIIEAGQNCDAPAGQFTGCIVVEGRNRIEGDKTLILTLTFAPKVGIIRVVTELDADGEEVPQARLELTAFEVKPKGPAAVR